MFCVESDQEGIAEHVKLSLFMSVELSIRMVRSCLKDRKHLRTLTMASRFLTDDGFGIRVFEVVSQNGDDRYEFQWVNSRSIDMGDGWGNAGCFKGVDCLSHPEGRNWSVIGRGVEWEL